MRFTSSDNGPVHMQDMSDDEKPLGFRADQLERKHKRQAKRQATTAEGKPASGAGAPQRPAQRAAAEPSRRRRREAAAGVAFAVQALAAVQAAAAADGGCLARHCLLVSARTLLILFGASSLQTHVLFPGCNCSFSKEQRHPS